MSELVKERETKLVPVAAADAGLDQGGLERIRAWIERDIDQKRHHGSTVLVARRGKVALLESFGSADIMSGRPSRIDDRYCTMSLAKSFTAAAILQTIDHGLLSFDGKVAEFIPQFGQRGKNGVTIFHLLTHTSGTWAGWLAPGQSTLGQRGEGGGLWSYIDAVCQEPLAFRPGERVYYNPSASYSLLGGILEKVHGKRYRDIMQERVFDVVGMSQTTCGLQIGHPNRVPTRMADTTPGVTNMDVQEKLNDLVDENVDSPSGLQFSTASDLFRFAETLRHGGAASGGRLFSEAMSEYAYRNHTGEKTNEFWDFNKVAAGIAEFPANFTLGGGYARGEGHYLNPCGQKASALSFAALGSGSTYFMYDPVREVTIVYLSAGLYVGLAHIQRCQMLGDLALAAAVD